MDTRKIIRIEYPNVLRESRSPSTLLSVLRRAGKKKINVVITDPAAAARPRLVQQEMMMMNTAQSVRPAVVDVGGSRTSSISPIAPLDQHKKRSAEDHEVGEFLVIFKETANMIELTRFRWNFFFFSRRQRRMLRIIPSTAGKKESMAIIQRELLSLYFSSRVDN